MGDAIRCSIQGQQMELPSFRSLPISNQCGTLALPVASSNAYSTEQQSVVATGSTHELDDINIADLFTDFEPPSTSNYVMTTMSSFSRKAMPVFHGCTINNLNITFNSK